MFKTLLIMTNNHMLTFSGCDIIINLDKFSVTLCKFVHNTKINKPNLVACLKCTPMFE